jgi:hypothetical protein
MPAYEAKKYQLAVMDRGGEKTKVMTWERLLELIRAEGAARGWKSHECDPDAFTADFRRMFDTDYTLSSTSPEEDQLIFAEWSESYFDSLVHRLRNLRYGNENRAARIAEEHARIASERVGRLMEDRFHD